MNLKDVIIKESNSKFSFRNCSWSKSRGCNRLQSLTVFCYALFLVLQAVHHDIQMTQKTFCSPWQTRSTSNHLNWPIGVELTGKIVCTLNIIMAPRLAVDTIFTSQVTRMATPALIQTSVTRTMHHRANRPTFFWKERITLYQAKLKHFTL